MTSSGGEPPSEDPRYGIAFSGGGALAAWEVGCADVIQRAHSTPPVALVGASAGGLNAAAFRAGMTPSEIGRVLSVRRGATAAGTALPSVLTPSHLAHTLRRHLSDRFEEFFASEVAFGVTAANIDERAGSLLRVVGAVSSSHHLGRVPASRR